MPAQTDKNLFLRTNNAIVTALSHMAIWSLAGMMTLTFIDVLLRYIFNRPIPGAAELIEFLMAIVIPFSIVYSAQLKSHIAVDFVIESFPQSVQKALSMFSDLLMLLLFVLVTWQTFIFIIDEFESNLTSPVLYIPVYPFIAMVALAFLVLTLILLEQFLRSLAETFS